MIAPLEESRELSEVLVRIQSWSAKARLELMRHLAQSIDEVAAPVDDAPTIEELEGIFDNGSAPPTDAECDQWLEEERLRKYG